MNKFWSRVVQGVGLAAVVASQLPAFGVPLNFGSGVPLQIVQWGGAAVGILGSVGQFLGAEKAHVSNPDGTPATQPYQPPAK